mgnify:FL=1
MPNALDYIDWRGDLPLSVSPFNEVDNLLICKLVSMDFTGIVPSEGERSIQEAAQGYFDKFGEEDVRRGVLLAPGAVTMLKKMLSAPRFQGLRLRDFVYHVDQKAEKQFSAMTIVLPDDTRYIAFRGTDDNLVAWKEDFNMGSLDAVPAQTDAASYLMRAAWRFDGKMRVGGHSKGGNLAVYAAMHNPEELQERIIEVYNNDGPGFREPVRDLPEYRRIASKIHTLVPQYSLVGVLLSHDADFEIVESTETGISAHNGYTWEVMRTGFVRCEDFAFRSRVFNDAIHGWADGLDLQQRQELTDAVFGALEATGAKTLTDLTEQKVRKALTAAKDLFGDEEQRELFMDSMELLFKEYAASAKRALPLGRLRRRKRSSD